MPSIGQPVVVGGVIARVVRRLEAGFAVAYFKPFEAQAIEALLVPPADGRRDVLEMALASAEEMVAARATAIAPG